MAIDTGPCGQRAGLPAEVHGPSATIFNEEGTGDGFELSVCFENCETEFEEEANVVKADRSESEPFTFFFLNLFGSQEATALMRERVTGL